MNMSGSNIQQRIDEIKQRGNLPRHIAIIMDGNGRWAKKRGLPRVAGHRAGIQSVRKAVEFCGEIGVDYLTLYTFSTENWRRPKAEVSALMTLLVQTLNNEIEELNKKNVRLMTMGEIDLLPGKARDSFLEGIQKTKHNTGLTLNVALSYGSREEIVQAVRSIAEKVQKGELAPESIDQEMISRHLYTANMPDPDLMIRTSGEFRISNFLLWQLAYTEIRIFKTFWPDFNKKHLMEAIEDYQNRERRFGQISEQLE